MHGHQYIKKSTTGSYLDPFKSILYSPTTFFKTHSCVFLQFMTGPSKRSPVYIRYCKFMALLNKKEGDVKSCKIISLVRDSINSIQICNSTFGFVGIIGAKKTNCFIYETLFNKAGFRDS
jgi:hypothetical protein